MVRKPCREEQHPGDFRAQKCPKTYLPFSRQRFVANVCPTANLSGNVLLRRDTTHKAKNSYNALYKNELDGKSLSSDLRQTFVAKHTRRVDTVATDYPFRFHGYQLN